MGVILRRKVDKIDEAKINNKHESYNKNIIMNVYNNLKKLKNKVIKLSISVNIDSGRELSFAPSNISKELASNYDFKNTKIAGDIIEAFCLNLLRDGGFKDIKDNHNGNTSPDFIIDGQYIEIKAHNNRMSNLSLGRLEKIEQSIISYFQNNHLDEKINVKLSDDIEKYLKMVVFIFNYDYDKNKIIITDIKYAPLVYILHDNLQTKKGGSTSVIAKDFNPKEYNNISFNDKVKQLFNIIKNKNNNNNDKQ